MSKRVQVSLSDELYEWLQEKIIEDHERTGNRTSLSNQIYAYVYIARQDELERKKRCVLHHSQHTEQEFGQNKESGL